MPADSLRPLSPGETREVTAEVWNRLVSATDKSGAPAPFQISASSQYAEVDHNNDNPTVPDSIHVKDITDWGGYDASKIRVDYSISKGPGLLETSGERAVDWSWPSSSWGDSGLPHSVVIEAAARVLTHMTTQPSVQSFAQLSSLTGVIEGDRTLVRGEGTVYHFSGGSWVETTGPTWVSYGSDKISIVVARSFDPNAAASTHTALIAEADTVELPDSGSTTITVRDLSEFASGEGSASRDIALFWRAPDGTLSEAGSELTATPMSVPNLSGAQEIEVAVSTVGEVMVRATYTTQSGNTHVASRRIRVVPKNARPIPTTKPPTLPGSVAVTPKNGRTRIRLAIPASIRSWEAVSGPRDILSTTSPSQELSGALTNRLGRSKVSLFRRRTSSSGQELNTSPVLRSYQTGVEEPASVEANDEARVTVPQASRLLSAATTIQNTLTSHTSGVVRTYRIELVPEDGASLEDLLGVNAGQVVYVPELSAALRVLEEPTARTQIDSETTGVVMSVEGLLEKEDHSLHERFEPAQGFSAHVTGSGDTVGVKAVFAYGSRGNAGFPSETFEVTQTFDPKTSRPVLEQVLPSKDPESLSDAWHVRLEIASSFRGLVYEFTEIDWSLAERRPGSEPQLDEEDFGGAARYFESPLVHSSPYGFYGYHQWVDAQQASQEGVSEPDAEEVIQAKLPMRRRDAVLMPSKWRGRQARLEYHGHYRAKAGSSQKEIRSLVTSKSATVEGIPVIEKDDIPMTGPSDAPVSDGLLLVDRRTGRVWLSAAGMWHKVASGQIESAPGFGDPTEESEGYNFAPVITGENHEIVVGRQYSDVEIMYVAEDYDGDVEYLQVSGVPADLQTRHQYFDDATGQWTDGSPSAAKRRVLLEGTASEAVSHQIDVTASDGNKASTVQFNIKVKSADKAGPSLGGVTAQGRLPDNRGVQALTATYSSNSATIRAEAGTTNIQADVSFKDELDIASVSFEGLVEGTDYILDTTSGTATLYDLSAEQQTLIGTVLDTADNSTRFLVGVEVFAPDNTPPVLEGLALSDTDEVRSVERTGTSQYSVEAYPGASFDVVFDFEDASSRMGYISKSRGPGGQGTQDGDQFTVHEVTMLSGVGSTQEIVVTAQDAYGNSADATVTLTTIEEPKTDFNAPVLAGISASHNGNARDVQWDGQSAEITPQSDDGPLEVLIDLTDDSGVRSVEQVSGLVVDGELFEQPASSSWRYRITNMREGQTVLRFTDTAGNTKDYTIERLSAAATDSTPPTISGIYASESSSGDTLSVREVFTGLYSVEYDSTTDSEVDLRITIADTGGAGLKEATLEQPLSADFSWVPNSREVRIRRHPVDGSAIKIRATDNAENERAFDFRLKDTHEEPPDDKAPVLESATAQTESAGSVRDAQVRPGPKVKAFFKGPDIQAGEMLSVSMDFSDDSGIDSSATEDTGVTVDGSTVTVAGVAFDTVTSVDVTDGAGNVTTVSIEAEAADKTLPQISRSLDAQWFPDEEGTVIGEAEDSGGLLSFSLTSQPSIVGQVAYFAWSESVNQWVRDDAQNVETTKRRIKITGTPSRSQEGQEFQGAAEAEDLSGNKTPHGFSIAVETMPKENPYIQPRNVQVDCYDRKNHSFGKDDQYRHRVTWDAPLYGQPAHYIFEYKEPESGDVKDKQFDGTSTLEEGDTVRMDEEPLTDTDDEYPVRMKAVWADGTESDWVFAYVFDSR